MPRIDFRGKLVDEPEIRAGFIGCGSHSFRNLYPVFQFAPVKLVATCDLELAKARAFAAKFGATAAYGRHAEMLEKEHLDAVFICTGYDEQGRPRYPALALDVLAAGRHVWIEKPPAATAAEIQRLRAAAAERGLNAMVGLKKMFIPANEKAKELMSDPEFGAPHLATIQYPLYVPTVAEFEEYRQGHPHGGVRSFLDHLCHPAALLVYLLGMPQALFYERSRAGGGLATFRFDSGTIASLALTHGAPHAGGMEWTQIVSDRDRRITVENNLRVALHRPAPLPYGASPSYYAGAPAETSSVWEPEFSLGQLYNKGLFMLGYYGEIIEFARSILERRPPAKGTLEQAEQVTRIFEAFAEGPGRTIKLCQDGPRPQAGER